MRTRLRREPCFERLGDTANKRYLLDSEGSKPRGRADKPRHPAYQRDRGGITRLRVLEGMDIGRSGERLAKGFAGRPGEPSAAWRAAAIDSKQKIHRFPTVSRAG